MPTRRPERGPVPTPESSRHRNHEGELVLFSKLEEKLEQAYERVEMDIEHTTLRVQEIVSKPERYIDEGGAGKVYSFGPGVCLKILEDRERSPSAKHMKLGNNVETEALFQHHLSDLSVEGARAPKIYGYWKSEAPSLQSSIIMEELDAVNAQHVINGESKLPDNFDLDTFFGSLHSFMQTVHETKRLVHGDIALRNIMIDRQTGMPRIIDFGRSKMLPEDNQRAERMVNEEFNTIEEVYDAFFDHLEKRGLIEPL